jgi:hypothetical protein
MRAGIVERVVVSLVLLGALSWVTSRKAATTSMPPIFRVCTARARTSTTPPGMPRRRWPSMWRAFARTAVRSTPV